jgi:glutamate/tyrosine decarboxylase-like PLP-dependent enzyme
MTRCFRQASVSCLFVWISLEVVGLRRLFATIITVRLDMSDHLQSLPSTLPDRGIGVEEALIIVGDLVRERSARLGDPHVLAHMDPPTPPIAAELVGLNASVNQNLLHPDLSPFATQAERQVIGWLAPSFGMAEGHMCAGSTIANLTALWCAREHGAANVVASSDAHLSVPKAAHILGMPFEAVPVDHSGRLDRNQLPSTDGSAVVLTAGTTGRGVIDDLSSIDCAWLHVDAAWAGPLRLTRYASRLDGIEKAHSVAVSAHKWLFQPKDSALVLFKEEGVTTAVSFGGSYLAVPNIGVQGSRSAAAVALVGTILAWGREGLAERIERCVALSEGLAGRLSMDRRHELRQAPETGVVNWRPTEKAIDLILDALGPTASRTVIEGETWVRNVAANPYADLDAVWERIEMALASDFEGAQPDKK